MSADHRMLPGACKGATGASRSWVMPRSPAGQRARPGLSAHTARMPSSFRDNQPRRGQTDVYWRRRVIALAAGIVLVGLVAWTVNGTLGGGSARQSANVAHVSGQHAASPTPAGGTLGAARTGSSAPQLTATPMPTASAHTKHWAGQASGTHRPGGGRHPARSARAVQTCAQAGIVLSVFTSRYSYPAHSTPQFRVDVVSTAPRTCSVNLATRHLHVLITSGRTGCGTLPAARGRPARGSPS
jgi:hypothetical protein